MVDEISLVQEGVEVVVEVEEVEEDLEKEVQLETLAW